MCFPKGSLSQMFTPRRFTDSLDFIVMLLVDKVAGLFCKIPLRNNSTPKFLEVNCHVILYQPINPCIRLLTWKFHQLQHLVDGDYVLSSIYLSKEPFLMNEISVCKFINLLRSLMWNYAVHLIIVQDSYCRYY